VKINSGCCGQLTGLWRTRRRGRRGTGELSVVSAILPRPAPPARCRGAGRAGSSAVLERAGVGGRTDRTTPADALTWSGR
jgi:hypothetical protein